MYMYQYNKLLEEEMLGQSISAIYFLIHMAKLAFRDALSIYIPITNV